MTEVQKSANCDLCGYFNQFIVSCQLGVRAARRDDAAAHAAVRWPIRGTGVRGEDLPHPDREQGGQGVSG